MLFKTFLALEHKLGVQAREQENIRSIAYLKTAYCQSINTYENKLILSQHYYHIRDGDSNIHINNN